MWGGECIRGISFLAAGFLVVNSRRQENATFGDFENFLPLDYAFNEGWSWREVVWKQASPQDEGNKEQWRFNDFSVTTQDFLPTIPFLFLEIGDMRLVWWPERQFRWLTWVGMGAMGEGEKCRMKKTFLELSPHIQSYGYSPQESIAILPWAVYDLVTKILSNIFKIIHIT